jgi:hypothetical protein
VSIVKRFADSCLVNVSYPDEPTSWHVQGVLKNKSNQLLKFDVRGMNKNSQGSLQKTGNTGSKAEKMVFEASNQWIIVDTEELHEYIKSNKIYVVHLDDLILKLDWNIILPKN